MNKSLVSNKASRRTFIKYMLMGSAVAAGASILKGTQFSSGDKLYSSQSSIFSPRIEKKNLFDNRFVKRFLVR
tara:strand:+ start:54 stop:272 length:219 start_codon:yes stop_codon:yes gene_type:complete